MELVKVKRPEDDSSSQWGGVGQSLKDPAPSRFIDNSILIPNLHIYENQTNTLSFCLLFCVPKVVGWFLS